MIYVVAHRDFDDSYFRGDGYQTVWVGNGTLATKPNELRDNTGDNIAEKNANYCELTAVYWLWKHMDDIPDALIGIVHYRRFLVNRKDYLSYMYLNQKIKALDYEEALEALRVADIILPRKKTVIPTVRKFYEDSHDPADLVWLEKVIGEKYPSYLSDYQRILQGHSYYYGNIMICGRDTFCKYCEWLFDILFELEKDIDIQKYEDPYQARVFGFVAERLLQVWVEHQKLSVKEFNVTNVDEPKETIWFHTKSRFRRWVLRK